MVICQRIKLVHFDCLIVDAKPGWYYELKLVIFCMAENTTKLEIKTWIIIDFILIAYMVIRGQLFHSLFWRNTFLKPDWFLTCVKLVFEIMTFAHVTDINISGPKNRLVSSYGFRNPFNVLFFWRRASIQPLMEKFFKICDRNIKAAKS